MGILALLMVLLLCYDSLFVGPDFLVKSFLAHCEQTGYSSFQLCKLKRPVEIAAYVCTWVKSSFVAVRSE